MNLNSIKLRLQIWYGIILLGVVGGLGLAAYRLESDKLYRQVDSQLGDRIRILAETLNGPPTEPFDTPENNRPPGRGAFHLNPRDGASFGERGSNGFYFIVTGNDGREIARSQNVPDGNTNAYMASQSAAVRSKQIVTPTQERILVGKYTAPELAELHATALKLFLNGLVILILGLAGGWYFVSRSLRPIRDISLTAEKISMGDLSQRIDLEQTKSELGQLAVVLNSMFEKLETSFARQRQFSADAAHELRTPVSVLIAQTHAAMIRKRSYEDNLQTIEACHRAAQRMRRLIATLLQLARLDAGQEKPSLSEFDLSIVADECVELLQPLADEKKVKMVLELTPSKMQGDSDQIGQVITNLLTNAIQYNRLGGEVRIQVCNLSNGTNLIITDTGEGIAEADLPHIWDRFYRAEKSRSSGNAGLGLAISRAIILAHGGCVEVASKANVGSTFKIVFPQNQPAVASAE